MDLNINTGMDFINNHFLSIFINYFQINKHTITNIYTLKHYY